MFLEQSGYNGFLWPTHCISFSWSLLLLWLPSLLLWNIPTHYLQPECVCKCSPTSGSTHFSLPALKKSISPWASKMMPAVATKLAPEAEATTNAGPDLWKATVCPHNHLFRLTPHGGWWGIKLATTTQAKPGWHVGVEFVMRTSPRHEINHVEAERQTQIVGLQALDSGTGWPESIDGDDFFMRAGVWEQQSIDISQLIFFTMRTSAAESKSSPLATLPLDRRTQVITRFESSFPTQLLGERLLFFFMSRLRKEIII